MCLLRLVAVFIFITTSSNGLDCPNREFIEESLNKVHVPGAVIIVVNNSHILCEQAFGYHSLSPKQPMDVDKSIFTLASISKTFIAVAVMQLLEKQLVNLDTDINQYLSEPRRKIFHPQYPSHSITLRNLLSHSASIAVRNQPRTINFQPDDAALTETTLADMCFTLLSPNTSNWLPKPPGSVAYYSNEGSSLAALVVERISNMSYDQYVREKILRPLEINVKKAGFRLMDFENRQELVKHYVYALNESFLSEWQQVMPDLNVTPISDTFPTWLSIPFFSFSQYPAGLLRMSARSLSVYLRMFMSNGSSLLTSESVTKMRTVVDNNFNSYDDQNVSNNTSQSTSSWKFGLSWYWQTLKNGGQYIGHAGGGPGMVNLMLVNEKNTVGIIVLSNGGTNPSIDLSRQIFETIESIHASVFSWFESNHH